jgi:hypothetical protein
VPTGSVGEHLVTEVHDTGLAVTAQGDRQMARSQRVVWELIRGSAEKPAT